MINWTQVDKFESKEDSCKSEIMVASSGNGGKKWETPIRVNQQSGNCIDEDFTLRGSQPLIVYDGKLFIMWSGQGAMFYDRSYDGKKWISSDLAISEQVGGWTLTVPGFGGVANTPRIAVDNSASRMHGTLFLIYADIKSGDTDSDIWLMRSVSRGDNWTVPARINQDKPGHHQFLPHISVDAANGFTYILYYDRRDHTDNQTDVYLAWSTDGGNQFKEKKLNEKPFTPDLVGKDYMEDYLSISAQKGVIVPVWTQIDGNKQEVYTMVIRQEDLK
jgi:hypothetical protein